MTKTMQAPASTPCEAHQRVAGRAEVSFVAGPRGARLKNLAQAGAGKAMLPRSYGATPEVVFLNTAGGLTAGDRLRYGVEIGEGARVLATTQTAERAYRSLPHLPPAVLDVEISVGRDGELAWLPQETILFEGAALTRRTKIDLAEGARCLTCETVVLGRTAMGETLSRLAFRDWREIRRDGRLVSLEPLALDGRALARAEHSAVLAGARAFASVLYVGDGVEDRLAPLRQLLDSIGGGIRVAASAWGGRLAVRAMAENAQQLRRVLAAVLPQLSGSDLPRVWQI